MAEADFKHLYSLLNAKQKEAVDYIDGPLLVLAGPGTGKTQLLALRVANILLKTDTMPENILCLTFSESAAKEMELRLNSIIGNLSSEIKITTFHSFGKDIIENNLEKSKYIGYKPINDIIQKHLISEILKNTAHTNRLNGVTNNQKVSSLVSDLKRATISDNELAEIINSNLDYLKRLNHILTTNNLDLSRISPKSIAPLNKILEILNNTEYSNKYPIYDLKKLLISNLENAISEFNLTNKTFALTKFKSNFLNKDEYDHFIFKGIDQYEILKDFNQIYKKLNQKMKSLKLYDYNDMILFAIEILKTNPEIKYNLQERYQYILIDEYQDSNRAQAEIVSLLTDNLANHKKPNVMAVGDDDQAIYAFQGAKYSNMLDFFNSWDDTKIISLNINYRSTQEIIDLFSNIAPKIENRLIDNIPNITKQFKSSNKLKQKESKIFRYQFNTEMDQNSFLASALLKDYKQKIKVGVLIPRNNELEKLANILESKNIKINYDHKEDILKSGLFIQIYSMLKLLIALNKQNDQDIDYYFSIVLNFDFLKIDPILIWEISYKSRKNYQSWLKELATNNSTKQIVAFFIKLSFLINDLSFDQIIDYLLGLGSLTIVSDRLEIEYKSTFLDYIKDKEYMVIELISNLSYLRTIFDEFIPTINFKRTTANFIRMIDELISNQQSITNTIKFNELSNINLMTVYGSKGLEFDKVYIISAHDGRWGLKQKTDNNSIKVPSNLDPIVNSNQNSLDQKIRLLYVALSRAKSEILITSFNFNDGSSKTYPLTLLEETIDQDNINSPYINRGNIKFIKDQKNDPDIYINELQFPYKRIITQSKNSELLKKQLQEFKLSPTALTDFLNIAYSSPEIYYYKHILCYPSSSSEEVLYGSIIHQSLEWLQNQFNLQKTIPKLKELLNLFSTFINNSNLEMNRKIYFQQKGKDALTNFYKHNLNNLFIGAKAEFNFKNKDITFGEVRLTGKIDLLIPKADSIDLIDYKTGKSSTSWLKDAYHYNHTRQLYFYRILLNNSPEYQNINQLRAKIIYLNPELNKLNNELEFKFNDQEIDRVNNLIKIVWDKTMALDFPNTQKYSKDYKGIINFENDLLNKKI
jgi:DNA helicase-2/ATP-dependent DNA helicase PcrA